MARLPLTVTAIEAQPGGLYRVTVAFADFSTANYLIPYSMATLEAVTISAAAMGTLLDPALRSASAGAHHHRRYAPRT